MPTETTRAVPRASGRIGFAPARAGHDAMRRPAIAGAKARPGGSGRAGIAAAL